MYMVDISCVRSLYHIAVAEVLLMGRMEHEEFKVI